MRYLVYLFICLNIAACKSPSPNSLVVGTISGPETTLVEVAKKVAFKRYGLTIKIVEFSDYNLPNEALADGSLDANVFQHLPYLSEAIKNHGYQFEAIGKTFVYPTGIYAQKIKNITQLPAKAIIAIPNDPSNEARALLLLAKAKLINLRDNPMPSLKDITDNPKQLVIKEMDAAQLPRSLPDVSAAVINTNFAIPAGLSPAKNAIFLEDKNSPYANLIVIRKDSKKRAALMEFVSAMNSAEVAHKAKELFQNEAIAAW